jgi:hypothetical protein
MRHLLISVLLSVSASWAGTYLLRKALSTAGASGGEGARPRSGGLVVVVPIFVGNSGNRFISENRVLSPEARWPIIFGRGGRR